MTKHKFNCGCENGVGIETQSPQSPKTKDS
jgi:hypothetical protein